MMRGTDITFCVGDEVTWRYDGVNQDLCVVVALDRWPWVTIRHLRTGSEWSVPNECVCRAQDDSERERGRPEIRIGDRVRWEFSARGRWAEGWVVGISCLRQLFTLRVHACSERSWDLYGEPDPFPGSVHTFGVYREVRGDGPPATIRSIPGFSWHPSWWEIGGRCHLCGAVEFPIDVEDDRNAGQLASRAPDRVPDHDGLSGKECLRRFERRMHQADLGTAGTDTALTPSQIAAARELWSAGVRARVAGSAEKDEGSRVSVVVDQDEDVVLRSAWRVAR